MNKCHLVPNCLWYGSEHKVNVQIIHDVGEDISYENLKLITISTRIVNFLEDVKWSTPSDDSATPRWVTTSRLHDEWRLRDSTTRDWTASRPERPERISWSKSQHIAHERWSLLRFMYDTWIAASLTWSIDPFKICYSTGDRLTVDSSSCDLK